MNTPTFEDRFLARGRHDAPERAEPSERGNKLQSVPAGVNRRKATCPQQLLRVELTEAEIADFFEAPSEPRSVGADDLESGCGPPRPFFDVDPSDWVLHGVPSDEL